MTVNMTVGVHGLRAILARLDGVHVKRINRSIVRIVHLEVRDRMAVYPPEGSWNWPGGPGSHWYQRGFGPRWMTKDGDLRGENTSEDLQNSWKAVNHGDWAEVYTTVSYADEVQGDKQKSYHADHGWQTDSEVVKKYEKERLPEVERKVLAEEFGQ